MGVPHDGINALIRREQRAHTPPCEDAVRRGLPASQEPNWLALDLGFPASRTLRNKCCLSQRDKTTPSLAPSQICVVQIKDILWLVESGLIFSDRRHSTALKSSDHRKPHLPHL